MIQKYIFLGEKDVLQNYLSTPFVNNLSKAEIFFYFYDNLS